MDVSEEDVETVESTRQLVEQLAEEADSSGQFDQRNLMILHEQLQMLVQALSVAHAAQQHD